MPSSSANTRCTPHRIVLVCTEQHLRLSTIDFGKLADDRLYHHDDLEVVPAAVKTGASSTADFLAARGQLDWQRTAVGSWRGDRTVW